MVPGLDVAEKDDPTMDAAEMKATLTDYVKDYVYSYFGIRFYR